jgi:predicted ATPase/transcriptional regulator with XRE-family HTH domain
MTYYPAFSKLLNQVLQRQDRSASWLAQRLGVSPSTVTRWLNHDTRPGSPELVARIAETLHETEQLDVLLRAAGYASSALPSHRVAPEQAAVRHAQTQRSLPRPATPLVGRTAEIEQLCAWVIDPTRQLITILGQGGMGKTRLALAVAQREESAQRFADGVAFADLAPLQTADQLPTAVAHAVGLPLSTSADSHRSSAQQVLAYLRDRHLLLILDNAEHLLAGAHFFSVLAQAAPGLVMLATSRAPLRVPGEQLYPLDGLDIDEASYGSSPEPASATALFLQAARRIQPAYDRAGRERGQIGAICRLVEGMPLAIELAAAWVAVLSAEEILAAIRGSLDFLASDSHLVSPRHRSMAAVFDATWQRLDAKTQKIFAQCSVFRGGFTRDALVHVTAADLPALRVLTASSLVSHNQERRRYAIHELLRQYGAMRLAEASALEETTRAAHAAFYLDLLARQQDQLRRRGAQADLLPLDAEVDNLRSAWYWAAGHAEVSRLAATLDGLGFYFHWRAMAEEGAAAFEAACSALSTCGRSADLLRAEAWQARFLLVLGQTEAAVALLKDDAWREEDPQPDSAEARSAQALALMQRGAAAAARDSAAAQAHYARALTIFRELDEPWFAAEVQLGLGHTCLTQGDFTAQRAYVEDALNTYRTLGHVRGTAYALSMLADIDSYRNRPISGLNLGLESLAAFRSLDDPVGTATVLSRLGYTYMNLGDVVNARQVIAESAAIFHEIGARRDEVIAHVFRCAAELMAGDYEDALACARRAVALATELDDQFVLGVALGFHGWALMHVGALAEALETLRQAVAITELTGATMDGARANAILALAQCENDQLPQARAHSRSALKLCTQVGDPWSLATALTSALVLLAESDDPAQAWELYGMLRQDALCSASRWFADAVDGPLAAARAHLSDEQVDAALHQGSKLDPQSIARALAEELAQ